MIDKDDKDDKDDKYDKDDKDDKDDRPACETVWIAAFGKLSARPTGLQSSGRRNP